MLEIMKKHPGIIYTDQTILFNCIFCSTNIAFSYPNYTKP